MEVAVFGDERALAAVLEPELFGCKDGVALEKHLASGTGRASAREQLAGAIVLCWAADRQGAYAAFREASERAVAASDFTFAACSLERFAHHAILFGDTALAAEVLDEAVTLSAAHALSWWMLRCASSAARLAMDTGDLERACSLLALAAPHARERDERALLAPIGILVATEKRDEAAIAYWTSPEIVEAALTARDRNSAIWATIALLSEGSMSDVRVMTALRRALMQSLGSSEIVEIFSLAARYAEMHEARLAANALTALVGTDRQYIKAHVLLARAHVLVRSGERAAGIDHAGDAARTFNAMGLRRWMNDAMMLLLRPEKEGGERRRRGRTDGAILTGREQQVAQLIRRGASNREVASALQISEHTVERHVSSILGRLGLRSRWQIGDPTN